MSQPTPDRSLVAPKDPAPELLEYWARAEDLCQRFAGLEPRRSELHQFAMQSICWWPPFARQHVPAWEGWSGRFDAATLGRMRGDELLDAICPFVGCEPLDVVAAMAEFVRWLGSQGVMHEAAAARLAGELERGAGGFARRIESEVLEQDWGGLAFPAAPFMDWLLDTTTLSSDHRLLGQTLIHRALDMLDADHPEDACWAALDVEAWLAPAAEDARQLALEPSAPRRVATLLLSFLHGRRVLTGGQKHQLAGRVRRCTAPIRR